MKLFLYCIERFHYSELLNGECWRLLLVERTVCN
uniref:Uncharacterized protein n=1 Tax=Anguilla anguilla TaxID=7936 RepID=A0A0E9U6I9_ANGAN